MVTALGVVVIGVVIAVIIGYFAVTYPEEFNAFLFPEQVLDVRFFESPKVSENDVRVNLSTIVTVTARNYDIDPADNVSVRTTVIKGANWQEHLKFEEVTKLSDRIGLGDVSDTKHLAIKAIKRSGEVTNFRILLELQVDGVTADKYEFDLRIIE